MRTEGEFRALQHGGPHPLHGETPSVVDIDDTRGRDPPPADPNADRRVVAHFDADCFYAQVEELRDPRLASRPVAVTQKYLVVTANYAARKAGVGKLMSVAEAKRLCPDAAFVCGEDLTPYRAFSKRIRHVLERFGACEKLGLDECWVDVTNEVDRRLQTRAEDDDDFFDDDKYLGHRLSPARTNLASSNRHRPMDLRIVPSCAVTAYSRENDANDKNDKNERRVRFGAAVAADARAAVLAETGVRCSAGVAVNKMCAKLVSGVHKPDDQTYLPPGFFNCASLVAPLLMRALPGVGRKTESVLKQKLGAETCLDARLHARSTFIEWLGARAGAAVHDAAWGVDRSEVVAKAPQREVTCQDSFRACEGTAAARLALAALAPDLVRRMDEEFHEHERVARRLVVRWRERRVRRETNRAGPTSVSLPMPPAATDARLETETRADAVVSAAAGALANALPKTFNLTLLAVGATSFFTNDEICATSFSSFSRERALSSFFANASTTRRGRSEDVLPAPSRAPKTAPKTAPDGPRRVASKRETREMARAGTRPLFFRDGFTAGGDDPKRGTDDPWDPVAHETAVTVGPLGVVRDSHRDDSCSDADDDGAAFFADLADVVAEPKRRRGA